MAVQSADQWVESSVDMMAEWWAELKVDQMVGQWVDQWAGPKAEMLAAC